MDKKCYKNVIKYYERKRKKYGLDLNDDIKLLFNRVKINPFNLWI